MTRRWRTTSALSLAALAYALLVLGSGLDRMAEAGSIDPAHVPAPFRVAAARTASRAALLSGRPAEGLAMARTAVARDPADAGSVGLLGAAAQLSGDAATAGRAFGVSATMGWREPLTRTYWLNAALARRDYAAAATSVDAILRQSPLYAGRNLYLAPLDAAPAGRAALARRLALRPAWAAGYFLDTADPRAGDPIARSEVAALIARAHGVRDCALIAPVLDGLVRFDHIDRAQQLYRLHCAAPGEPAVPADGGFERADIVRSPTALDWRFTDEGAINLTLVPRPGLPGRALTVGSAASITLPFARQRLALAPGPHRVAWRALDAGGAPAAAIDVSVSCAPDQHAWLAKTLADPRKGRFIAGFSTDAACPAPTLVLGIAGQTRDVAIDDVRID